MAVAAAAVLLACVASGGVARRHVKQADGEELAVGEGLQWRLGDAGQSCDAVCLANGERCDYSKQAQITSSSMLEGIAPQLGVTCAAYRNDSSRWWPGLHTGSQQCFWNPSSINSTTCEAHHSEARRFCACATFENTCEKIAYGGSGPCALACLSCLQGDVCQNTAPIRKILHDECVARYDEHLCAAVISEVATPVLEVACATEVTCPVLQRLAEKYVCKRDLCRPGQDIKDGTFVHVDGSSHSSGDAAASDEECDRRCGHTPGCTAWVRPTAGNGDNCWMHQGSTRWEEDHVRNAGVPGCIHQDQALCRPGQDIKAGTFVPVHGPSHSSGDYTASDEECNQRCYLTPGCTAWIRPTEGNGSECWMHQGAAQWEEDHSRNAGAPGCSRQTIHGQAAETTGDKADDTTGDKADEFMGTDHDKADDTIGDKADDTIQRAVARVVDSLPADPTSANWSESAGNMFHPVSSINGTVKRAFTVAMAQRGAAQAQQLQRSKRSMEESLGAKSCI